MKSSVFFGNAGDERGTPQEFFTKLDAEFHFDLDAAASPSNHKCELYFGEGGMSYDALDTDWGGPGTSVFLNPPYSIVGAFIAKAKEEAQKGATVVLLLPVRSDTKWWHKYVWETDTPFGIYHDGNWRPGVRGRFLPGRLNFELQVADNIRKWIKSELLSAKGQDRETWDGMVASLIATTGLPRMAIERIDLDRPDDSLLDSAPFPSCVIIFNKE